MKNPDLITEIAQWLGSGSINIFGRPFAGKDTQGKILADLFGGDLLGGGEILRGSEMPDHIKAHMRTGKLIPTDDYISIVLPYLSKEEFTGRPLILSSVGRWHGEEAGVIGATSDSGHQTKAVIYLDLDESKVIERWKSLADNNDRGTRHDDTLEILNTRLAEYREKTLPVIEHYRGMGLLIEIDGDQSPEQVTNVILQKLASLASTSP